MFIHFFWWNDEQITDNSLLMFCTLSTLITRIWMPLLSLRLTFFVLQSVQLHWIHPPPFHLPWSGWPPWQSSWFSLQALLQKAEKKREKKKNNAKTKRHDNLCKFSVLNLIYWTTQVVLFLPLIYCAELLSRVVLSKKTKTFWTFSLFSRMCCHIIWGKLSQRKPAIKQPFSKIHDKILETADILNVMYNIKPFQQMLYIKL